MVHHGARFSLHTGEVVGSIPTAPTIFQALIGSIRQLTAERYGNVREESVQNRCNLFAVRTDRRTELKAILKTELPMRATKSVVLRERRPAVTQLAI